MYIYIYGYIYIYIYMPVVFGKARRHGMAPC
jgi:hypothetical protein